MMVVSEDRLPRDAIVAALCHHGLDATALDKPVTMAQLQDTRRALVRAHARVGILLSDITGVAQLREATAVVTNLDLDWIVLTNAPPGATWGALLDAGAADVLTADLSLGHLVRTLVGAAAPPSPYTRRCRSESTRAWHRLGPHRRQLVRRFERLTPREMEILVELHVGESVSSIADRAGVSAGTVRSQVKSVLRKLDVCSQLQAVVTFRQADSWFGGAGADLRADPDDDQMSLDSAPSQSTSSRNAHPCACETCGYDIER